MKNFQFSILKFFIFSFINLIFFVSQQSLFCDYFDQFQRFRQISKSIFRIKQIFHCNIEIYCFFQLFYFFVIILTI